MVIFMLDTRYNNARVRQSHTNNDWKKRPHNNSRFGKRGFVANTIDINRFINKAQVVNATEVPKSKTSFGDFAICDILKRSIANCGFTTPTPIQDRAIPAILTGRDVIGLANTGTGKTAAFLIPMINKILANPQEKVLIIVPVRELAIQIQEDFRTFAQKTNLFATVIVGGANIQRQMSELHRGQNVVIGTPGRLKDLITRKKLNLSGYNNVILDEADRMLDMGFINDVKFFLSLVSKKRQTMLFSATFGREIEKLVNQFLSNPERISLRITETSKQIDQDIVRVTPSKDKFEILYDLLNQTQFEKVLVFTRTKYGADKLSKKLSQKGFKSESIHGGKPHNRRQRALKMFKENSIKILIATDVAARGLDIPNVSHVINFDIPATFDDYIHRIGRTGRAGQLGKALTFVN